MAMYYSNRKGNVALWNGLGPSVFGRKMERTSPMREEMDGKVLSSRQIRHFNLRCCYFCKSIFPYLYLDLACKQLCFPSRKKYKWEK